MYAKRYKYMAAIIVVYIMFASCEKGFLDAKPEKSLTVPKSLDDLQAILDNSNEVMNWSPSLGLISSDDIYITDAGLAALTQNQVVGRNAYSWQDDIYSTFTSSDWDWSYKQVFYANVVLEGLDQFSTTERNSIQAKSIEGSAYFFRALAYYQVAQHFADTYEQRTAHETLGIPLKHSAAINEIVKRGTLKETYDQIIKDLENAIVLLPETSNYLTRPSQTAALALLARTFLTMELYDKAAHYASACLKLKSELLDYNTLDPFSERPFPRVLSNGVNSEVLFYSVIIPRNAISSTLSGVDTLLYKSYDDNDLRKNCFFRLNPSTPDVVRFKGFYTGTLDVFTGLSLNEVYLIRAESNVRLGNIQEALSDINYLLAKRWKDEHFTPVEILDQEDLLAFILQERRKELVFRDLRWTDLRRLNKDDRFKTTISRKINNSIVELPPADPRYTLPIPIYVILKSGIEQNPRTK